jgi:hypothetical protein
MAALSNRGLKQSAAGGPSAAASGAPTRRPFAVPTGPTCVRLRYPSAGPQQPINSITDTCAGSAIGSDGSWLAGLRHLPQQSVGKSSAEAATICPRPSAARSLTWRLAPVRFGTALRGG